MRRSWRLPLLAMLITAGACDNPSQPNTSFSVLGQWVTSEADTLDIRMTLSETARQIHGAGSWVTPTRQEAFAVVGARADDDISLHLDIEAAVDVTFQGQYRDTPGDSTLMIGQLYGGIYRGTGIVFVRHDQ